jgi:hypothetical protein
LGGTAKFDVSQQWNSAVVRTKTFTGNNGKRKSRESTTIICELQLCPLWFVRGVSTAAIQPRPPVNEQ